MGERRRALREGLARLALRVPRAPALPLEEGTFSVGVTRLRLFVFGFDERKSFITFRR